MPKDIGLTKNTELETSLLASEAAPARRSLWWQVTAAASVLVAGVLLSLLGSKRLVDYVQERERRALEEQATSKAEQVQIAIDRALESLTSVRAFHDANGAFTAAQFSRFVKSDAAFHRGTLALGWAPRVTLAERGEFERTLQPVGGRTARIFETNSHGLLVSSPAQPDYFPVHYLVSLIDGELVQGMNLTALSWLRQPLEEAIEKGRPVVVARMGMAEGRHDDYVLQAFLPVFHSNPTVAKRAEPHHAAVAGFSMGLFSVTEIFRSAFDATTEPYNVSVFDFSRHGDERLMFTLRAGEPVPPQSELRRLGAPYWVREFRVADQTWQAVFVSRKGAAASPGWLPYMGLAAGVLMTSILSLYLFVAHWRAAQVLRLSQSLHRTQQRLFDERVTTAVQSRLREQAEASEVAKTHLLQAASHDLRQPMHALGLYLGHARAETDGQSRWLNAMQQSFDALRTMFDALLDWSRLESGRLQPRVREINSAMIERIGNEYGELAREKGLQFGLQVATASIRTDPVLLERVLRNLLANAVRYTAQGRIVVTAQPRGACLRIRIVDSGPGIAATDRERLFGAFERGDRDRHRHDGLGLGLAIARQTLDLMGHTLRLTSSSRRGSIFTVTVPLGESNTVHRPDAPESDSFAGRRFLVVDDDPAILAETAMLFERWGAEVGRAHSVREAEQLLNTVTPDCLIVDQYLPDGTGLAFIDRLQNLAQAPAAILVSGDAGFVEQTAQQRGDLFVLVKPVAPLRFRSVIHYLLT